MTQIQIIASPEELQSYFDSSLQNALKSLGISGSVQPAVSMDEKPITVKELCIFLDVTEPTLIRWRKKGKIPFLQIGSRILFQKSAVIKALESKRKG